MPATALSDATLQEVIHEVYRLTGITMDASKRTMLTGRLLRRIRRLELGDFESYLDLVRRDEDECIAFVDAVTTHKTSMFRTAAVWHYLRDEWLPELSRQGRRSVQAWSAASSTGEEAASMAVTFAEAHARGQALAWRVLATDVSRSMVERASLQRFDSERVERDARQMPEVDVLRHFSPDGDGRSVLLAPLRGNMEFRRHNVFEPLAGHHFDLIMLRNVIIYFSGEDKRRAIEQVCHVLRPGGLLVIGESESMHGEAKELELVGHCIYRRTP